MPHLGEKLEYPTGRGMPRNVTVGASPFTFTAPSDGNVVVSGGSITLIQYGRGDMLFSAGLLTGPIFVANGDKIQIVYLTMPTITFFPM